MRRVGAWMLFEQKMIGPVRGADIYSDKPMRRRWGLPPECLQDSTGLVRIDMTCGDDVLPEDCAWTAWAFAGTRCARAYWSVTAHRPMVQSTVDAGLSIVMTTLRNAMAREWLTPVGDVFEVNLQAFPYGVSVHIRGLDPILANGFLVGWQVAALRIASGRAS